MKQSVNQNAIRQLVQDFYGKIRQDPMLQPVFDDHIGDNWNPHLERMVSFWSTVMLGSHSFQGNVYGKHMLLRGIEPEHFQRWLALFEESAETLFEQQAADQFKLVAHRIGASLQLGFFNEVLVP